MNYHAVDSSPHFIICVQIFLRPPASENARVNTFGLLMFLVQPKNAKDDSYLFALWPSLSYEYDLS